MFQDSYQPGFPLDFSARVVHTARGEFSVVWCQMSTQHVTHWCHRVACGVSVCLLSRVPTVPLVYSYETTLPIYIQ